MDKNKMTRWVRKHVSSVAQRSPQAVHLDEMFLADEISNFRAADYVALIKNALSPTVLAAGIRPVVVVPIGITDELAFEIGEVDGLLSRSQPCSTEPPSFYLVDRLASLLLSGDEEYRRPLTSIDLVTKTKHKGTISVYYRCFRGPEAQANEWEFESAIYFEFFPKNLV